MEIATDFPFLGARDYVHGTSVLSGFLSAMETNERVPVIVKRLKFQRPARSNGRLLLTTASIDDGRAEQANCTFQAAAGATVWRGLFEESGVPVARRIEVSYAIDRLEARAFSGSCTISAHGREELIRTLVEANKRFHEASLEGAARSVRFGYLEDWAAPAQGAEFSGTLEAKNLIARKTADGHMTISRLRYGDTALTLCYHVTLA
jgi:hypothetical protein